MYTISNLWKTDDVWWGSLHVHSRACRFRLGSDLISRCSLRAAIILSSHDAMCKRFSIEACNPFRNSTVGSISTVGVVYIGTPRGVRLLRCSPGKVSPLGRSDWTEPPTPTPDVAINLHNSSPHRLHDVHHDAWLQPSIGLPSARLRLASIYARSRTNPCENVVKFGEARPVCAHGVSFLKQSSSIRTRCSHGSHG